MDLEQEEQLGFYPQHSKEQLVVAHEVRHQLLLSLIQIGHVLRLDYISHLARHARTLQRDPSLMTVAMHQC